MKIYNYFKNISQEFRLKNIDETRNLLLEEIKQNELMSKKYKKYKKVQKGLYNSKLHWTPSYFSFYNYWMYFNFASLVGIPVEFTSSAIGLRTYAIATGIKKYESMIKKKKKKHDKVVLLAKRSYTA